LLRLWCIARAARDRASSTAESLQLAERLPPLSVGVGMDEIVEAFVAQSCSPRFAVHRVAWPWKKLTGEIRDNFFASKPRTVLHPLLRRRLSSCRRCAVVCNRYPADVLFDAGAVRAILPTGTPRQRTAAFNLEPRPSQRGPIFFADASLCMRLILHGDPAFGF
jgi:hypothetical protein